MPQAEDDGEWEYNKDMFNKKLEKMDETKKQQLEEEEKLKEAKKLKEIATHRAHVVKLQQTFGLDVILEEIECKHS